VRAEQRRRERRRLERRRRAASRRLPPVHGGGHLATGGRARPVRMVGVGQFARGMARRQERRTQAHGWRRVAGAVAGVLIGLVVVLWVVARVAGHL
ncbi:MAG: hypothetical protein ACRDY1_11350, partial [Acidimicrobiales bacterium]